MKWQWLSAAESEALERRRELYRSGLGQRLLVALREFLDKARRTWTVKPQLGDDGELLEDPLLDYADWATHQITIEPLLHSLLEYVVREVPQANRDDVIAVLREEGFRQWQRHFRRQFTHDSPSGETYQQAIARHAAAGNPAAMRYMQGLKLMMN